MNLRWLVSKKTRDACTVHKHYRRLLAAQRDVLPPQAITPVQAALDKLAAAIQQGACTGVIACGGRTSRCAASSRR